MTAPPVHCRSVPPARHWPGLDGVRGIAIVLVIAGHAGLLPERTGAAPVGVTVFFTLSGFLITNVLLRSTGERRLAFYGDRAARLAPALLLVAAATGIVWLALGRPAGVFAEYAASALLYVENFLHGRHDGSVLSHTWSLAVEEQFYLLWPLTLPLLARSSVRTRALLLAAGVTLSVVARFGLLAVGMGAQAYASLPANGYAMLAGCALALLPMPRIRPRTAGVVGALTLGVALGYGFVLPNYPHVAPVLATPAAVLLIVAGTQPARALEFGPLRYAGTVSYSWYLWHWPLLVLFGAVAKPWPGVAICVAALIIAAALTRWVEAPIRRRWRVRSSRWRTRPDGHDTVIPYFVPR